MSADARTFTLDHPVEVGGQRHETLVVRRPVVRDLIAAERQPGEIAREANLLSICAGVGMNVVGALDVRDYHRIAIETGLRFFSVDADGGDLFSSSIAGPAGD